MKGSKEMIETKFTPGPWRDTFHDAPYGIDHVIKAAATKDEPHGAWIANASRNEANARLIAEAPRLYAALEALVEAVSAPTIIFNAAMDQARAALVAARGEA